MKLTWYGHSFFLLESAGGTRIAVDPCDPPTGYPVPSLQADAIAVTHSHHDHSYVASVPGARILDLREGATAIGEIAVTALPSFHDEAQGAKRGSNTIFVFEADGLRVAHLGDLGADPGDAILSRMGRIDVLLLPVGGVYTIDTAQAAALADKIGAPCVIPMHYKTPHLAFELAGIQPFLRLRGGSIQHCEKTIELRKSALVNGTLIMKYL